MLGEDVSGVLEYVPSCFKVVRHVRPRVSCRACEAIGQASMSSLPIGRGRPAPALLAHVLVARYGDHLPLHRQSVIHTRAGLKLDRSTLAALRRFGRRLLRRRISRIAADGWALPSSSWPRWPRRSAAMSTPDRRSCRRHAGAGARPGPWQDQDRPVSAGRGRLLEPRAAQALRRPPGDRLAARPGHPPRDPPPGCAHPLHHRRPS